MSTLLSRTGLGGLLAMAILAGAATLHVLLVRPLEHELQSLEREARQGREPSTLRSAYTPVAQMSAFYHFFDQPIALHEWLARLYAVGRASGVDLPSADYSMRTTSSRLKRYQLTLPVRATYAQARAFMANALNEIPILSVDRASFRRPPSGGPQLEVEIVMTLHLLEP